MFGITGSGKDTFLNTLYGKILNNENIHSNDDKKDKNHIDSILNSFGSDSTSTSTYTLKEKWFCR